MTRALSWPLHLWPDTLVGRAVLVVLIGLLLSNLIGIAVYTGERVDLASTTWGRVLAERVVQAAQILEETPPRERPRLLRELRMPGMRLAWSSQPLLTESDRSWQARRVHHALREALDIPSDQLRIHLRPLAADEPMAEALPHGHRLDRGVAPRRAARAALPEGVEVKVLAGSFALGDGTWLNFATAFANLRPFWSTQFFLIIAATLLIALSASVWAVRWASRPLTTLAGAAERLGLDIGAPALSEEGPREVRLASRAFNEMQQRLQGFVRDRTQMLAAISHDLRTPITRMRLRAELVDDAEQRGKMLADLAEMEAMIAATLSFARDDPARESPEPLDLAALIQSLVADAADAGAEAHYQGPDLIGFTGRPTALKRAFGNLIDNAIAYGGSARVAAAVADQTITVTVADSGPGIPPDERDRVFEPFYRIEGSRSRETGGVGLGLAVVRSAVRAHGGEVELGDGPGGGLIVTVTLPRAAS